MIVVSLTGGLGNQMFQYAALKGIAAHRGYEYTIPPENPRIQIDNYGLIEAFELSDRECNTQECHAEVGLKLIELGWLFGIKVGINLKPYYYTLQLFQ